MFYPRVNSDELKVPPENKKVDGGSECKKKNVFLGARVFFALHHGEARAAKGLG